MDQHEIHPSISLEDFLLYYYKAFRRDNIKAMFWLHATYPDVAEMAFDPAYIEKKSHCLGRDIYEIHPITVDSPYLTERRVLDMIAYLFAETRAPAQYQTFLRENISTRRIFSYTTARYQEDYDRYELWDKLFQGQPKLKAILDKRKIYRLDELEYHAREYFLKWNF